MVFYDLASEVTQCHFSHNPFVPSFKGRGNGCWLLVEELQRACGPKNALAIFENTICHIYVPLERE